MPHARHPVFYFRGFFGTLRQRSPVMSRTAPRIALVSALVGLAASSASAYVHYRMLRQPGYLSFCDVSATMSCTEVYASPYGSVGGISVAVFGVLWFALAALLATAWLI